MRKALPVLMVAGLAGVAVLLARQRPGSTRESLLPPLRFLQEHEKQLDRAATRVLPVTPEEERAIGAELDARLRASRAMEVPPGDAGLAAAASLLAEIGPQLARAAPVKRFPGRYRFQLLRGGTNAFVIPGGFIYVLEGLARRFRGQAGPLAFVLSHEIGHAELGHTADSVRAREWFRKAGLADAAGPAELLRFLAELHFSETQELEADAYAVKLMRSARFDPADALAALDLIDPPSAREVGGRRDPGAVVLEGLTDYARTHPAGFERRSRVERLVGRRP